MPKRRTIRRTLGALTAASAAACVTVAAIGLSGGGRELSARVVSAPGDAQGWLTLTPAQVASGITLPAGTNVVFQIPIDSERINRETFFGNRGRQVRYWGYCLPENYEPETTQRASGFPGKLFLSEKEREVQAELERSLYPKPSIFAPPVNGELEPKPHGLMRHQVEIFDPGSLCYVMTETPLPVGTDQDHDQLNSKLEADVGTDLANPDTDEDGISDGVEQFNGLKPLQRDTDLDNLIDGLEDLNANGRVNFGETDPRNRDSDRDGLCDGLCMVRLANGQFIYMGEDTNLNGQVDAGEADPKTVFTRPDLNDYNAFLLCRAGQKAHCFP